MTTLILVHVQAEFPESITTRRAIHQFITRHEPDVHQLVRGGAGGLPIIPRGLLYNSCSGEVPQELIERIGHEPVILAGGERQCCLNRAENELLAAGITSKLLYHGIYSPLQRIPRMYDYFCGGYVF